MSAEEFERVREAAERYERARVKRPYWPRMGPVAFVEIVRPRYSFLAWAALQDIPCDRAEDIREQAEGTFGPQFFAFRQLDTAVPNGLRIGETLLRMGVLDQRGLQTGLDLQREIADEAGVQFPLGILLVMHNRINLGAYIQALTLHFGLDATAINDDVLEQIDAASRSARA